MAKINLLNTRTTNFLELVGNGRITGFLPISEIIRGRRNNGMICGTISWSCATGWMIAITWELLS